jgi:hypothetical protein
MMLLQNSRRLRNTANVPLSLYNPNIQLSGLSPDETKELQNMVGEEDEDNFGGDEIDVTKFNDDLGSVSAAATTSSTMRSPTAGNLQEAR